MAEEKSGPFEVGPSKVISALVGDANGETGKSPPRQRKHEAYPSETKRKGRKATYDLDPDTIAAVKDIAVQERVPRNQSKVAEALLSYAVAQYRAGRLALKVTQDGENWRLEAVEK